MTQEGGRLFAQATDRPRVELFPESDRDYFLKVEDVRITFETDSQGRATGVIVRQYGANFPAKRIE